MNQIQTCSISNQIADAEYAARIARMLMGTYPQQEAKDCDTYLGLVVTRLVGEKCDDLKAMMDPRYGLISEARFLPTIAEINTWLTEKDPEPYFNAAEHRLFLPAPEPEIDPEERARNTARLEELSRIIKATVQSRRMPRWGDKPVIEQTPEQEQASLKRLMQTNLMREGRD